MFRKSLLLIIIIIIVDHGDSTSYHYDHDYRQLHSSLDNIQKLIVQLFKRAHSNAERLHKLGKAMALNVLVLMSKKKSNEQKKQILKEIYEDQLISSGGSGGYHTYDNDNYDDEQNKREMKNEKINQLYVDRSFNSNSNGNDDDNVNGNDYYDYSNNQFHQRSGKYQQL